VGIGVVAVSLRGNVSSIKKFSESLRALPKVVAAKVAEAAAPAITAAAVASFTASETPYGVGWDPGYDGSKVTLRRTGALAAYIRYVAIGTKLRVALGVPYAKYQIGRRPVFPAQGATLPQNYLDALKDASDRVIRAEMAGA
jgi:hypothetical protein